MAYDPRQELALGPQPQLRSNQQDSSLFGATAITAGVVGAGFIPVGKNKRVWDKYIGAIRTIEEVSPAGILRTFKISEFLSPLESFNRVSVAPFEAKGGAYGGFVQNQFGKEAVKGVTLTKEGALFGTVRSATGETLGVGVGMKAGTQKGTGIADYFARISGTQLEEFASLNEDLLRSKWREAGTKQTFADWKAALDVSIREQRLLVGQSIQRNVSLFGKNIRLSNDNAIRVAKGKLVGNILRAKAAATVGRLNVLLAKPFEMPVVGDFLSNLPGIRNLPVKQGTATQMFGGYLKKALLIGAAWKGLEYLDYQRSEGTILGTAAITGAAAAVGGLAFNAPGLPFSSKKALIGAGVGLFASLAPRFQHGLFHGAASIGTDANLMMAKASDVTGVTESLKEQSEVTPGLLKLQTAIGFAGVGGLAASVAGYGKFLGKGIKEAATTSGTPKAQIFRKLRDELKEEVAEKVWSSSVGKKVASLPGGSKLSKIKSPFALGALAGITAWQGLVSVTSLLQGKIATAVPGVALLGSEESAEDLEKIYSGEEEVAIRKGRFWEMGRSKFEGGQIDYYRPHMIHRLKTRSYQKGLWGDEEEKWEHDPLLNPIDAIFGSEDWKYYYEKKYQYERPAPVTSTYGEDIPFIGPLVAATVGRLLKPRKLVRPEEWMTDQGPIQEPFVRPEEQVAPELGGLQPGAPVESTRDFTNIFNKLNYMRREAVGLPGFIEGAFTKSILGREEAFPMETELSSMGKETGPEYWLWKHLNIGGGAFSCFVPGTQIKTYNGLKNIEDIQVGDLVLSKGSYRRVIDKLETSPKSNLLTIELNEIGNKITCTDNHWIPVLRRHSYSCGHLKPFSEKNYTLCDIQAKDIKEGDYLLYQIDKTEEEHCIDLKGTSKTYTSEYVYSQASVEFANAYELLEKGKCKKRSELRECGIPDLIAKEALRQFRFNSKPKRRLRFIPVDEDFAYVIGWYIAEGNTAEGNIVYTLNANEILYAEKIADIFNKKGYETRIKVKKNTLKLWVYSSNLSRYFEKFGKGAHNKYIPQEYKKLPINILSKLIEGLILGDGWGKLGEKGGFTSVSKQLVRDLYDSLLRLGYQSYLTTDYIEKGNGFYPQGTPRKDTKRNYLRFKEGRQNWKIQDDYILVKVTNISEAETVDTVFDLTIEDIHYYTAEGILVHNTEAVRRFIPRTPSNWEFYNPLQNNLPSWIPDDYFLDLKHGNPLDVIPEGEIRLPGKGFEALHPELKGIHPEAYPLAYKVKILGDVAMWSEEYKSALRDAKMRFKEMTPKEVKMVVDTERQVKQKKKKREFSEYKAFSDHLTSETVKVREVIDPRHVLTEEYGNAVLELQGFGAIKNMEKAQAFAEDNLLGKNIKVFMPKDDAQRFSLGAAGARMKGVAFVGGEQYGEAITDAGLAVPKKLDDDFAAANWSIGQQLAGGLSEAVLHNIETPLDYLTPLAPASKLIHQRSAIEEYIATQAVGTQSSFWDRPVENFLAPTANMLRYKASPGTYIPESIERKRAVQQYFDMLTWKKANMLEKAAKQQGNMAAAEQYREQKQQTVFGADVYGNPTQIMRALPRSDRDFYGAFVNAKTQEDKEKILSLVPKDQQRVYMAAWHQKAAAAARAKIEAGIATEDDQKIIQEYRKASFSEGYQYSTSDIEQYHRQTDGRMPFDDYMREQIANDYFSKNSLPDPSWLGFNSAVDLQDVKLIYAESAGIDYHDMDLWDARKRALARKPYINESLLGQLTESSELSQGSNFVYHAGKLPSRYNSGRDISTITVEEDIGRDRFDLQISDKRTGILESTYKEMLGGR